MALQGVVTQQLLPRADGTGRACVCEVLIPTPAVRNLIREGKTHQIYSVLQTGGQHGMQTMDSALADFVRAGVITKALAETRSSSPADLKRLIGSAAAAGASDMPAQVA
jgi:twitching motility protein PilT